MSYKPRNLFNTTTVRHVLVMTLALISLSEPTLKKVASTKSVEWIDILQIVMIIGGMSSSVGAIVARYRLGGVYTPDMMAGLNKTDLVPPQLNENER